MEYDIIVSTLPNLVGYDDDDAAKIMGDRFLEDIYGDASHVYIASPGGGIEEMQYAFFAGVRLLDKDHFPGAVKLDWRRDVVVAECKSPTLELPGLGELTFELHDAMVSSKHKEAFVLAGGHQAPTWESAAGYEGLGVYNDGVGRSALAALVPGQDGSETLLLPSYVPNLAQWLTALIPRWRQLSPSRFPLSSDWSKEDDWSTMKERHTRRDIAEIEEEKLAAITKFDDQIEARSIDLELLSQQADNGPRRLLTAQGKELVDAVNQALKDLGFDVTDVDEELETERGQKLEDLQVRLPDSDDEWLALVEVRGYTGGAKTSDFQRLGRFASRYERETGTPPGCRWLIVNHLLNDDPTSRPSAFESAPEDLETFAEDGGLVIDTRDLFRVGQLVEGGDLSQESASQAFLTQTGLFELPNKEVSS